MQDCNCSGEQFVEQQQECCCGPRPIKRISYVSHDPIGVMSTPAGEVDVVGAEWTWRDRLGGAMVRLGYGRMSYAVEPGLYASGNPWAGSPVLVTANYKLTFDVLRRDIDGLDCWILVLDTKGVNVWCAAGKGTFGTAEVMRMVGETELEKIVSHRTLILPQLGAPGVSARAVERGAGFKVVYGPVRANDITSFLNNGLKASEEMRQVRFDLPDRLTVSMLELTEAGKKGLAISAILWLLLSIVPGGLDLAAGWQRAAFPVLGMWTAIISGSVLTAALLPWLPGRMFSVKGAIAGASAVLAFVLGYGLLSPAPASTVPAISLVLLGTALSSYIAMNFTGASTFTSLSGVKREIKASLPFMIGAAAVSAALQGLCLIGIL